MVGVSAMLHHARLKQGVQIFYNYITIAITTTITKYSLESMRLVISKATKRSNEMLACRRRSSKNSRIGFQIFCNYITIAITTTITQYLLESMRLVIISKATIRSNEMLATVGGARLKQPYTLPNILQLHYNCNYNYNHIILTGMHEVGHQ